MQASRPRGTAGCLGRRQRGGGGPGRACAGAERGGATRTPTAFEMDSTPGPRRPSRAAAAAGAAAVTATAAAEARVVTAKVAAPALAEPLNEELRLKCGPAMKALRIKQGKLAQQLDCDTTDLGRWLKGEPRRPNCAAVRAA